MAFEVRNPTDRNGKKAGYLLSLAHGAKDHLLKEVADGLKALSEIGRHTGHMPPETVGYLVIMGSALFEGNGCCNAVRMGNHAVNMDT